MFKDFSKKLINKISRALGSFLYSLEWDARCLWLNSKPRIYVSKKAFIKRTAQLQLNPQGMFFGGSINIDQNSLITDGVIIAPYGGSIKIESNVFIGPYCVLYGHGGLKIGKNTMIAAHSIVVPSNHSFVDSAKPINSQPHINLGIEIGEDVWIGCGVKILDGVSIGNGCVIGAGSVVNRSLPDYSIAVGVPARVIKKRRENCKELSHSSSLLKQEETTEENL